LRDADTTIIMLALFCATASLTAPRSAVASLRLRGGDSVDMVTNTMSGLQIASGIYAWMAPENNIKMYGYEDKPTEVETAMMRYLAIGQVVLGSTSLAGYEGGTKAAQSMALTGGAASLLACAPVFEGLGGPKEPLAAWIAIMLGVGKGISSGKIESSLPGTILGGVAAAQALVSPKKTYEMYKNKVAASDMALALFALAGGNLLANTAYVAIAKDEGHKKGLMASLAILAANCIKFGLVDATRVGFKPAGAIVWGIISAAGALKLK
jgi:hypothetical protein